MKYQKYLVLAFVATLFLPLLSAKTVETNSFEFDLDSVNYIETENVTELGFDTKAYLPEGFDAYSENFAVESINYIEEEASELGFDTKAYLPANFDAYQKL